MTPKIIWIIEIAAVLSFLLLGTSKSYETNAQNSTVSNSATNPEINWPQTIATGLIAAIGIFVANIGLDRVRRWYNKPDPHIDENLYPVTEPINLEVFNVTEPTLRHEYWDSRKFMLAYKVFRLKVQNTGRSAAEDCKGVLNDGEDKKLSWNVPSERHKMTINAHILVDSYSK